MRIEREKCIGLLIDVQERLYPVMDNKESLLNACSTFLKGLSLLGIPLLITEQYPKGLGPTVKDLRELSEGIEAIEKISFSCMDEVDFEAALQESGRRQVLVAGIESHVCVLQTVRDLQEAGYKAVVLADATSSRKDSDREVALERMRQEGAVITTVESLLFELCRYAGTPEFRQISNLVK